MKPQRTQSAPTLPPGIGERMSPALFTEAVDGAGVLRHLLCTAN